jgi:hypothetical protein
MPCNQLAVQTARLTTSPAVLTALFDNALARNALTSLLQQQTGASLTAYRYSNTQVLNLYASNVDINIYADGNITVRGTSSADAQRFTLAIQAAIAQVAGVLVQNMIAQTIQAAGVPVVADEYTAAGSRVMTLRL